MAPSCHGSRFTVYETKRAGLRLRPFSFLAYDRSLRHGSKHKHVSRGETLHMRVTLKVCALLTALCVLLPAAALGQKAGEAAELNAKIRRFAPTVVTADTSELSAAQARPPPPNQRE